MQSVAFEYAPRRPEETLLYEVIAQELETFLRRQQERDRPVPHFIEQEFRSFLDCGLKICISADGLSDYSGKRQSVAGGSPGTCGLNKRSVRRQGR